MAKAVNLVPQEQKYKKPGTGAKLGGAFVGYIVWNSMVRFSLNNIPPKVVKEIQKIDSSLSSDEFLQVEKAIADTVKKSGLGDKGVSIIRATAANKDEIREIMTKEFDGGLKKIIPKKLKEFYKKGFLSQIDSGSNACYTSIGKKIITPEKKLSLALFTQVGHAANANLSKFGGVLQKYCHPIISLALPIALIALLKTKKSPDEKPKNGFDKATTFIKDNAGKLTFATFLPLLAEEGRATLKGNKFAKQFLNADLARKVAKTNALGFSTYLGLATFYALGIYLGNKIKDAIIEPRPLNKNK